MNARLPLLLLDVDGVLKPGRRPQPAILDRARRWADGW
jgi:hypothetical protein